MAGWTNAPEVATALSSAGYLADPGIAQVVFLADRLDKPILAEGPAGVGKTALALAMAEAPMMNLSAPCSRIIKPAMIIRKCSNIVSQCL